MFYHIICFHVSQPFFYRSSSRPGHITRGAIPAAQLAAARGQGGGGQLWRKEAMGFAKVGKIPGVSKKVTFFGVSHLENSTFLGHPPWFWLNFFWVKMISQRKWWMADGSLVSPGWIMARHFNILKDFLGLDGFTIHPIHPQSNTSRSLDFGIGWYNPFKFGTVGLYHPSN